jgi:hypothetical protein
MTLAMDVTEKGLKATKRCTDKERSTANKHEEVPKLVRDQGDAR